MTEILKWTEAGGSLSGIKTQSKSSRKRKLASLILQHGYWHFHLTFVRRGDGRGLGVIDLLLSAGVY